MKTVGRSLVRLVLRSRRHPFRVNAPNVEVKSVNNIPGHFNGEVVVLRWAGAP